MEKMQNHKRGSQIELFGTRGTTGILFPVAPRDPHAGSMFRAPLDLSCHQSLILILLMDAHANMDAYDS